MSAKPFILGLDNARVISANAWRYSCRFLEIGKEVKWLVDEYLDKRTREQNALMWAMLDDVAEQVEWYVDGALQKLESEEWKDIFTAGLKKHQRVAAGIFGGFVILGAHTSGMSKRDMSDLIELMYAFGGEHKVTWTPPKKLQNHPAWRNAA